MNILKPIRFDTTIQNAGTAQQVGEATAAYIGKSGADVVILPAKITHDCRNLLGGEDVIVFPRNWSDYTKSLTQKSGAIVFDYTDPVTGGGETVLVLNGATSLGRDKLVFADGAVLTQNARQALTQDIDVPITLVTGYEPGETQQTVRAALLGA